MFSNYFKNREINSIFFKYFRLIFIAIVTTFFIIIFLISRYYISINDKNLKNSEKAALNKSMENFETIVSDVSFMCNYLSTEQAIYNFLISDKGPQYNSQDLKTRSVPTSLIKSLTYSRDYITSVYIYSPISNSVMTESSFNYLDYFDDKNFIKSALNNFGAIPRKMPSSTNPQSSTNILSFVKNVDIVGGTPGLIIVNMNVMRLGEIVDVKNSQKGLLIITDKNDVIIYATKNEYFNNNISSILDMEKLKDSDNGIFKYQSSQANFTTQSSTLTGFKFYLISPIPNYYSNRYVAIAITIFTIIISLILSILLAYFMAVKLSKPIEDVLDVIENPEQWADFESKSQDFSELRYISQNILKNLDTHKEMEKQLAQRIMLLKNAQSLALYSQITPHFLFNTLQSINLIALETFKSDNKISDTINLLADMLRISLKEGENIIPLSTEIKHAKYYQEIQKHRYGDLFDVEWKIENGLDNFMVPKVILQPLIENAIYHGIKNKTDKSKSTIWIDIKKNENDDGIIITVSDNGIGMSDEDIKELNHKLETEFTNPVDHIGLQNVNQRIKITYGDIYGVLVCRNPKNNGLQVIISIPIYEG